MKSSKKSTIRTITAMIILGGTIFGIFMYAANQEEEKKTEIVVDQTEVDKILGYDFEHEYPLTAREVVKFYARTVKEVHSEGVNEEVVTLLGDILLKLYCEELIAANPRDEYIEQLIAESKEYQTMKKVVISYAIDSSENAVTWKEDGVEYTRIIVSFTTKEGNGFNRTYEEVLLKKDSQSKWKIIGWQLVRPKDE